MNFLGIKTDRVEATPGFDVTTPGGFHVNVSGQLMVLLLALVVAIAIFAWMRVSLVSIEHGGGYVRVNHITASPHTMQTNLWRKVGP